MTLAIKNNALILKDGKLAEDCDCCGLWYCYDNCCPQQGEGCTPTTVASWVVGPDSPCVDLRPYRYVSAAFCGRPWRFVERGATCNGWQNDGVVTWFDWGIVAADGRITIIYDPEFCSEYPYAGYMYLEIGCSNPVENDFPFGDFWPNCVTVPK